MSVLRNADVRFRELHGYPFAPNYFEHQGIRGHYLDEGPRDAAVIALCLHCNPAWSYLYRKMIPVFSGAGLRVVAPDLAVGRLIARGKRDRSTQEVAAFDAPFPDASYKAALRAFPNLVPDGVDAPGAALSCEARAFWRERWQGDSFMAIGMQDSVFGPPVLQALAQSIRGCPAPLEVAEGGTLCKRGARPSPRLR